MGVTNDPNDSSGSNSGEVLMLAAPAHAPCSHRDAVIHATCQCMHLQDWVEEGAVPGPSFRLPYA